MTLTATCHCGATRIELPGLPTSIKTCNCSFCNRAGAVWGYYQPGEIKIVADADDRIYSSSGLNNHHFCGNCGMQTWGDSPDWASIYNVDGSPKDGYSAQSMPTERTYAVNLRLIDDLDLAALDIEHVDGKNSW